MKIYRTEPKYRKTIQLNNTQYELVQLSDGVLGLRDMAWYDPPTQAQLKAIKKIGGATTPNYELPTTKLDAHREISQAIKDREAWEYDMLGGDIF